MSTDVYVLQRDLPYIKAGTEYVKVNNFNGVGDNASYVPNKIGMMWERFAIHLDYVENNPEWFKKKEQPVMAQYPDEIPSTFYEKKDYEVLSVKDIRSSKIWFHESWGYGHGFCGNSYEYVLNSKIGRVYEINSVKRLSDGEVFTVGDELSWVGKINSIRIDSKYAGGVVFDGKNRFQCLSTAEKLPSSEPTNEEQFVWDEKKVSELLEFIQDKISPNGFRHFDYNSMKEHFKKLKLSTNKEEVKTYTEQQVLDIEEKAFNAGGMPWRGASLHGLSFPMFFKSFSDYKNIQ